MYLKSQSLFFLSLSLSLFAWFSSAKFETDGVCWLHLFVGCCVARSRGSCLSRFFHARALVVSRVDRGLGLDRTGRDGMVEEGFHITMPALLAIRYPSPNTSAQTIPNRKQKFKTHRPQLSSLLPHRSRNSTPLHLPLRIHNNPRIILKIQKRPIGPLPRF